MSITVTIDRLGHRGDGIAPGPVYVPRVLPGEVVSGNVEGSHMVDARIETPSADRVRPPCRHYNGCGGCQLLHASDSFVSAWKQEVVRRALAAQGLDPAFRPIVTSPTRSRRRAGFAARRTKKGTLAGFHGRASTTIVDIDDCQVLHPAVLACLPAVRDLAAMGASRKGGISAQVTLSPAGPDVAVTGGKPADLALRTKLAGIAGAHGLARLAWDGEVVAQATPPFQIFGRARVVPPPGAFLQATQEGEAALVDAVREATRGAAHVADLFSGCGTFSLPLAETAEVHAAEGDAAAIAALDDGWRGATGLKRVTAEARDLFRRPLLADELARFDALVLDPPRAGAEAQAREIAASGVSRIAYVSCNPVTFARDVSILCDAGFRLEWVQVVDQFRWSPHVELAAALSRS